MKTTVSTPDDLFAEAERLARRHKDQAPFVPACSSDLVLVVKPRCTSISIDRPCLAAERAVRR
jgi:hypothetical protein